MDGWQVALLAVTLTVLVVLSLSAAVMALAGWRRRGPWSSLPSCSPLDPEEQQAKYMVAPRSVHVSPSHSEAIVVSEVQPPPTLQVPSIQTHRRSLPDITLLHSHRSVSPQHSPPRLEGAAGHLRVTGRSPSPRRQTVYDRTFRQGSLLCVEHSMPSFGGVVRPAVSCESLASESSVKEIGGDEDLVLTGQLEICLHYNSNASSLGVHVEKARGLTGSHGAPYYVTMSLHPGQNTATSSKVVGEGEHVWQDNFTFQVDSNHLPNRSLKIDVVQELPEEGACVTGVAELFLGDLDLWQPLTYWLGLQHPTAEREGGPRGEILFSLSYLPTSERLAIVISKARHLTWPSGSPSAEALVKVYLLSRGRKVSKKKTSVKQCDAAGLFNEAMIFSVPPSCLQAIQLRVTVTEVDAHGSHSNLGHVIVGSNEKSSKAKLHWTQMLASVRRPVAMWHQLSSGSDKKESSKHRH